MTAGPAAIRSSRITRVSGTGSTRYAVSAKRKCEADHTETGRLERNVLLFERVWCVVGCNEEIVPSRSQSIPPTQKKRHAIRLGPQRWVS